MPGPLTLADLAVLIIYLGAMVGMGCWLSRRSRTTDEFIAAGRSLPGWAVGLSIFGTFVSSISFLANPGKSYSGDWNPFVFGLSLPIAALIAVRFFIPHYRKSGHVSAYTHLEDRFGPWARFYAMTCYLVTQVGRVGTILYLVALALVPLTGWDIRLIIAVTGVLVILYTIVGGIEAVIWTDVVQSIVLTLGILLALALIFTGMPDGPGQVFTIAADSDKFSLGSLSAAINPQQPTFWIILLYGLAINLQNFGIDQSYVQRYATARSDRDAARSVWLGALLYLPVSALLFLVGTALFAFYQAQPDLLPAGAAALKGDAAFPYFIAHQMPAGLRGLLVAAILAAAMSSVDSSLNSSATLILCDLYRRFRPGVTEAQSMKVLYAATAFFGILGVAMAFAMIGAKSALDAWWKYAGIASGGMLGLFLLGIIAKRAKNPAAIAGVVAGILIVLWGAASEFLPNAWQMPLHASLIPVIATLAILAVGAAIAKIAHKSSTTTA